MVHPYCMWATRPGLSQESRAVRPCRPLPLPPRSAKNVRKCALALFRDQLRMFENVHWPDSINTTGHLASGTGHRRKT
eukprot:scaffold330128_cov57-Tisochrysis_lutea.AAC.1